MRRAVLTNESVREVLRRNIVLVSVSRRGTQDERGVYCPLSEVERIILMAGERAITLGRSVGRKSYISLERAIKENKNWVVAIYIAVSYVGHDDNDYVEDVALLPEAIHFAS